MFQSLRANNQVYILHKDATPYLEVGTVMTTSAPVPVMGSNGQMVFTVDVTLRVGENTTTLQKLPANATTACPQGNGNIVVSMSREQMNEEINSMRQHSAGVINSVEYHQNVIAVCDKLYQMINPEVAKQQRQDEEINSMKSQIGVLTTNMEQLMEMNRRLMEQLGGAVGTQKNVKDKKE